MIKSDLITAVNTQLTAIITQAKVRLASLQIINELYPTTQNETQATAVITTADANFEYDLNFTKIGRSVNVTGSISNVSGSILGFGSNVFEFNATEFLPNTTINQLFEVSGVKFTITPSNELQAITSIGSGQVIYINIKYSTLN